MKKLSARKDIQNTQSLGQLLQVFFLSIELDEYKTILQKYGITEFKGDQWYPTKLILEVFEEIEKRYNSIQNLVSIGLKVTEAIDFRSRFPTFDSFMAAFPQMEHEMHRNNPGDFEVTRIGPKSIEIVDRTVWPHDLEYGVLYGICRLYQDQHDYLVERTEIVVDPQTGDEVGIYQITWS
ncbi:MAG: hypothetical protein HY866_00190 [Chloroflexi bacterium]|nr:hypothetical protein [Chloroflexota bacterium]